MRQRAIAATLSPAVEVMLWHYARGVPKQTMAVDAPGPIFQLNCLPALPPDPALSGASHE